MFVIFIAFDFVENEYSFNTLVLSQVKIDGCFRRILNDNFVKEPFSVATATKKTSPRSLPKFIQNAIVSGQ